MFVWDRTLRKYVAKEMQVGVQGGEVQGGGGGEGRWEGRTQ